MRALRQQPLNGCLARHPAKLSQQAAASANTLRRLKSRDRPHVAMRTPKLSQRLTPCFAML